MLDDIRRVHLIGIGGIGVSGVARALLGLGYEVSGSDVRESQITTALRHEGATVHIGHSADHVRGVDLVVFSTAVPETNPELVAAREQGVPVRHRAEVLGAILDLHETAVGVIGTHGKGTVSAAIAWILEQAGARPGFIIGGMLENFAKLNARLDPARRLVVAEVDESDGSLKHVHPTVVVVNNLEADHLNYYKDLDHVLETVVACLNDNPRLERVIVNADDAGARSIIPRLKAPVTTFGREWEADLVGFEPEVGPMDSHFRVRHGGQTLGEVALAVPGLYNIDNALAAITATLQLGVSFDAIQAALATYHGLENRFTVVDVGGRRVIKDYISHPTGIRRVLAAAKQDGRPIVAVFKPYRFTMVNYHQDNYAEAFHDADRTLVTELYTAGEVPIPGIDTEFLCDKIRSRGPLVEFIPEMNDIVPWLHANVGDREQVIFFGGDDLFALADRYATELREGRS